MEGRGDTIKSHLRREGERNAEVLLVELLDLLFLPRLNSTKDAVVSENGHGQEKN